MSELTMALAVWLPLGTVVPFILAKLTGADWRGAFIETAIFATMGLIIFPILLGLTLALIIGEPNVDLLFGISYILAIGCVILFRRRSNQEQFWRRYGMRQND